MVEVTVGSFGYRRGVVVDSARIGGGDLMFAGELQTFDGPWDDIEENVKKKVGTLRYSAPLGSGRGQSAPLFLKLRTKESDGCPCLFTQRKVSALLPH